MAQPDRRQGGRATYILRYFLPRPPYKEEASPEPELGELISFCRRTGVEAVQFYCNFLPNWYYMPDTLAHSLAWAEEMKAVAARVREAGLSFQLNFQMLLGAHTGSANMRHIYDWEYAVDHRGRENDGCACPIGLRFRRAMEPAVAAWAATEPDIFWIDDDFRLHNHANVPYADWYCYCPLHLARFAARFGQTYTRERLVTELLAPGEPSAARTAWLDVLDETMAETAEWIERVVHRVSPRTRLAQMTSIPDVHAVEGRNWSRFLLALAGDGRTPIVRPTFGPYAEREPSAFVASYTLTAQMMQQLSSASPLGAEHYPELENTRFTAWAKTAAATKYQLLLGQLLGARGITLSLYDLEGTPLSEEPDYERVLSGTKPALDALAALELERWQPRGVAALTDPGLGRKVELSETGSDVGQLLGPGRTWDHPLLQLGVPLYYASPEQAAKSYGVTVLDGTTVWLADDAALRGMLEGGILLDANAAEALLHRGFGKWIGLEETAECRHSSSAEWFVPDVMPGLPGRRMPLRLQPGCWRRLKPASGAVIVSEIIDPLGERSPGTVLYRNERGGRVAVYAGCRDVGNEFYNHQRVRWVGVLLEWLGAGTFPLAFAASRRTLCVMRECDGAVLLAFANLAADPIGPIAATVRPAWLRQERRFRKNGLSDQPTAFAPSLTVWLLTADGSWECCGRTDEIGPGEHRIRLDVVLSLYDWCIVKLERPAQSGSDPLPAP